MRKRRLLGIGLMILGLAVILARPLGVTGAVVGLGGLKDVWFYIVGMGMIVSGVVLIGGLETIIKTKPGKGIKGDYVPLKEILEKKKLTSNKVNVELRDGKIFRDGRPIQGFKVVNGEVEFTGYHFTDPDSAKMIEQDQGLEIKNYLDPFIYLLEAMSYAGMNEKEVRHQIGSSSAEEALNMKIRYPLDRIYLKFNKDRPTHYAIEGNVGVENIVPKKGEYITRRKISEL